MSGLISVGGGELRSWVECSHSPQTPQQLLERYGHKRRGVWGGWLISPSFLSTLRVWRGWLISPSLSLHPTTLSPRPS
jgi:hypothetical protein